MKIKSVKISVIVPVYNVEKYLAKCVDSLLSQTMPEIEIILVDDGSPDNCPQICDEYAKKDCRVKVCHKKNGGLSSARNEGLKHVTGEFYMFVDSDDWLALDTCKVTYDYVKQTDADCLMFSYTKEFGDHSIVNHIFNQDFISWNKADIQKNFHRRLFGLVGEELSRPQDGDLIVSACMQLFKTEKFKDIRFVDTQKIGTEDCWYQILVYDKCDRFVYIDKPFYHYLRINDGSLTTKYNPNLFARWQNMYNYMHQYITDNKKPAVYTEALQNRICLSVLGAGINQAHSDNTIFEGSKRIKEMLTSERYENALSKLDTSVMPFPWKVFFYLAKLKFTTLLFVMLKMIEYLRTHKR